MTVNTNERMGFVRVGCMTADLLRRVEEVRVHSSLTDMTGEFGEPTVFSEWGIDVSGGTK